MPINTIILGIVFIVLIVIALVLFILMRRGRKSNKAPYLQALHMLLRGKTDEAIEGLKKAGDLLSISSLCNACEEVCPVRIPIPKLIRKLREAIYSADDNVVNVKQKGYKKSPVERMIWKGWQQAFTSTSLNTFFVKMAGIFSGIVPQIGPLKHWTSVRSMPKLAKKSLHQIVKEMEDVENE